MVYQEKSSIGDHKILWGLLVSASSPTKTLTECKKEIKATG